MTKSKKSTKPEKKVSYKNRNNSLKRYQEDGDAAPKVRTKTRLQQRIGSNGRVLKPKRVRS